MGRLQKLGVRLLILCALALSWSLTPTNVDAVAIPAQVQKSSLELPISTRVLDLLNDAPLDSHDSLSPFEADFAVTEGDALHKRGNCFSSGRNIYTCSPNPPTVQECLAQVQSHGRVGSQISVFFTGLGSGAGAIKLCKSWFQCHLSAQPAVIWDDIVDNQWLNAQGLAIMQSGLQSNLDVFQKRLSQAFAEASAGDAYLCTPETNAPADDFVLTTAWGGWEYPALTRNSKVNRVIRVDPNTSNQRTIWTHGDAPTANAPAG